MTPKLVVVALPRSPYRCLLPLLLLLIFRVVSSSSKSFERKKSPPFEWTTCQQNGTTTDVSIVSAELSPDPVRPGGAATFVLRGVVTSDDGVPDSAVIDVDIRYQSVPVYRDVLKLCETVRKNDDENGETTTGCPIRKKKGNNGTTTTRVIMEYDAKVPELAPSGEFDARFLAKRRSDDDDVGDVFCVEATLQVKGPFHQRGLDARKEEDGDDDDDDDWVEENERGIIKVS